MHIISVWNVCIMEINTRNKTYKITNKHEQKLLTIILKF